MREREMGGGKGREGERDAWRKVKGRLRRRGRREVEENERQDDGGCTTMTGRGGRMKGEKEE